MVGRVKLSRRRVLALAGSIAVTGFLPSRDGAAAAPKDVEILIDLSQQSMDVMLHGDHAYHWKVSTARPGYRTPVGRFRPYRLERVWFSIKYDNAPMPHSIFFLGGYAIHGTTEIRKLGRPVSHGCIRLHPDNARILFGLVRQAGMTNTGITIQR